VQLENHAGIVVEAAAEGGREADASHVDAARGKKADARFERLERRVESDAGLGGERAQVGGGFVGIAADAPSSACSRKRSAISPTLRPPTWVMPAIDRRSATSARAALGSEPASAARTPRLSVRVCAAVRRSRSWARLPARLKSLTSRRFQPGASARASSRVLNSATSPMRISGCASP
jgi:hypothetical protein